MIVFDLRCGGAHVFEAWFGSSEAYDRQLAAGLIACPLCGDTGITKAAMAAAVPAKANRSSGSQPAKAAALLQQQRRFEAMADDVGRDFAVVARSLHDGETPARSIYGEATLAEARELIDDGIAVLPLPFRPRSRSDA